MTKEEMNFAKNSEFSTSMVPGKFQKFLRTCVIWQFVRFVVLNIKMLVVVRKSH